MAELTVLNLQETLILAEITDLNGEPLDPDDDFGPLTQSAWVKALTIFDDNTLFAPLGHEHTDSLPTSVAPHGHISTTTVGRITPS